MSQKYRAGVWHTLFRYIPPRLTSKTRLSSLNESVAVRLDRGCMSFSRSRPNFCNIAPQTIKVALINSGTPTMGWESWSEVSILESLPRTCNGTKKRDFPLGNEKRRFVETLGNVKSICHASIACRRILIALLYWNEGIESGMQASAA